MNVSNKTLSVLLIAAIVVSIGGTMLTLTSVGNGPTEVVGRVTTSQTGETNFSINSSLSIRFVNSLIAFGTGTINDSGVGYCQMGTNGTPPNLTVNCIGFNTTVDTMNLTIENNGNIRANVSINFTGDASSFIGGSFVTPLFMYAVYQNETGSCATLMNGSNAFKNVSGYDLNSSMARICTNLNFTDVSDSLGLGIYLLVPKDATPGRHNVTITATGCDDASC